jgi:excisionase family DNA binding protein
MATKRNLLRVTAAFARLGCSRSQLYRLIQRGLVVAYKMGGRTMVDVDSIDAYHASLPRIEPAAAQEGRP